MTIACPFCDEPGYDLIGLKSHIAKGECEVFENTETIRSPFDCMKTPKLLDVPKDSPTRKERVDAFKAKHQIETHSAGRGWPKGEHPWSALLMEEARDLAKEHDDTVTDIGDAVAKYCRLLDEAGWLVTGVTETDAIRRLCDRNEIPFDL